MSFALGKKKRGNKELKKDTHTKWGRIQRNQIGRAEKNKENELAMILLRK